MRRVINYLLFSLLLMTGWANALAQGTATETPAQRLKLTLVDNKSTFNIDDEVNHYENTLRLGQADGNNKLTAGLLKEGDNYIVISRQGDTEANATEVARVNLNANIVKREAEILTDIELTSTTLNEPGWSVSNNRALSYSGTYGCCRISSGYSITYTIPQGYEGGTIMLNIGTYTAGYFKFNNGSAQQAQANTWNRYSFSGLNSGSTITIQGCNNRGTNANSPYIAGIYIIWVPPTIVPTINVTSTYSKKVDGNWVNVSTLGSNSYSPNDNVNANSYNVEYTDDFNESTSDNSHPNSYNYSVNMDANIDWIDLSGDFYASVDFSKGDGQDMETAEYIGPNNWDYLLVSYYTPNGYTPALYLTDGAELIYTMPATFAGNSVNVMVTTPNHSGGSGKLVVNGESYTLTAGSSHTWTVPVSANGVIRFLNAIGENYTCDISKIVIQSGNGSANSAPLSQPAVSKIKQVDKSNILNAKDYNIQTQKMSVKK